MPRQLNRLSARRVVTLKTPGMHADGGGLYLRISTGKNSGKRWVFLYRRRTDGKRCEIGLGGTSSVPLEMARKKAAEARVHLADGRDPRSVKNARKQVPTFGEMADEHIGSMESAWRNPKHRAHWKMTLEVYAKSLRNKPVDEITTADVLEVLRPIWQRVPDTASRVRGRIEVILDSAKAQGHRSGENPAAWRGHLKLVLPPKPKLVRHHKAMSIDNIPDFMSDLRTRDAIAARCLEFAVLTAARTKEALEARWEEIDFAINVWTVSADRMKMTREHRVPLCERAIEILREIKPLMDGDFIFPGQRRGKPLSTMALAMVLRRMGVDVTVHGFRSTFRDWAGNRTSYPRELAEHALSHQIGDKAEQAYRRDDALERRRPMMEDWAAFCTSGEISPNVVQIVRRA